MKINHHQTALNLLASGLFFLALCMFISGYLAYAKLGSMAFALFLFYFSFLITLTTLTDLIFAKLYQLAQTEHLAEKALKTTNHQLFNETILGVSQQRYLLFKKWGTFTITIVLLFITLFFLYMYPILNSNKWISFPPLYDFFSYGHLLLLALFGFLSLLFSRLIPLSTLGKFFKPSTHFLLLFNLLFFITLALLSLFKITSYPTTLLNEVNYFTSPIFILCLCIFSINWLMNSLVHLYKNQLDISEIPHACYDTHLTQIPDLQRLVFQSISDFVNFQFALNLSIDFLQKWALKKISLALILITLFFALISSLSVVPAGHLAYIQSLGAMCDTPLENGLHFTLPWPLSKKYLFNPHQINTLIIGSESFKTRLWSEKEFYLHAKDFGSGRLVYNPQLKQEQLLSVIVQFSYIITDYHKFIIQNEAPQTCLAQQLESELVIALCSTQAIQDKLDISDFSLPFFNDDIRFNQSIISSLNHAFLASQMGVKMLQLDFLQFVPALDPSLNNAYLKLNQATFQAQGISVKANKEALVAQTQAVDFSENLSLKATQHNQDEQLKAYENALAFEQELNLYQKYGEFYQTFLDIQMTKNMVKKARKFILFIHNDAFRKRIIDLDFATETLPDFLKTPSPSKKP